MNANFQEQWTTLTFSTKICPKMGFGVGISKFYIRIWNLHPWDSVCTSFQTKQTTLNFGAQIYSKMDFGVRISKNKVWIWLERTPPIYHVCQFSVKMDNLIFLPKFGEIAQLRAIFWFKYCWGCCRELGGGWNELGGGGWSWVEVEMSWVEVDGAGWRWVHGLVIPIIKNGNDFINKLRLSKRNTFKSFMVSSSL